MAYAPLDPKQSYRRDFVLAETATAGTAGYCYNDAGVPKFAAATSTAALTPTDFDDKERIQSAHVLDTPADRGTVAVVYQDADDSDKLKVMAIDLENETEGTAVTVTTYAPNVYFQVCHIDKANGKGLIAYLDDSGGWDVCMVVAFTVSGTTVTLGTAIQVSPASHDILHVDCVGINTDIAAVSYRDHTAAYDQRVAIVTCTSGTGTTLTEADDQSFYSTTFAAYLKLAKLDTNKFVVNYMASSYAGRAKVGTWSAPNLTFGSEYVFDNPAYSGYDSVQVDTNKYAIIYGRASDTVVRIGSVLGTAISWGTRYTVKSYVSYTNDMARFADEDNQFVCMYRDLSGSYLRVCSVTGTTIGLGEETKYADYVSSFVDCQGLDNDEFVFWYYHPTSSTCWYQIVEGGVLSLGINRAVGVLEVSGSAGDTRNVTLLGGVSKSLTGLTPGARYWIQLADGSLDTVETEFPFGLALDTDEFFVFRGTNWAV